MGQTVKMLKLVQQTSLYEDKQAALLRLFCRSFVWPASVTSPLISTILCFRPYNFFCKDLIRQCVACYHILLNPIIKYDKKIWT